MNKKHKAFWNIKLLEKVHKCACKYEKIMRFTSKERGRATLYICCEKGNKHKIL